MRSRFPDTPPSPFRTLGTALVITVLGIGIVSLIADGFASEALLRALQGISLFVLGSALIIGTISLAVVRLGGWRTSDGEFDLLVERSERLARSEYEADTFEFAVPEDGEEPLEVAGEDAQFDALVKAAIDELPIEFHRALEHVAIVISDSGSVAIRGRNGRRRGAYGMYQGDTVAHDYFTERILIFRDTLLRDFGHDPELLRQQVRRVLRHELAHHLGWGERGVRNLGL